MMVHGGVFRNYYSRTSVTHIIASNLPDSKIKDLKDKKVVKPQWITDSIKAEKLLPYQSYVLYSGHSTKQRGLNFTFSDNGDHTSTNSSGISTRSRSSVSRESSVASARLSAVSTQSSRLRLNKNDKVEMETGAMQPWVNSPKVSGQSTGRLSLKRNSDNKKYYGSEVASDTKESDSSSRPDRIPTDGEHSGDEDKPVTRSDRLTSDKFVIGAESDGKDKGDVEVAMDETVDSTVEGIHLDVRCHGRLEKPNNAVNMNIDIHQNEQTSNPGCFQSVQASNTRSVEPNSARIRNRDASVSEENVTHQFPPSDKATTHRNLPMSESSNTATANQSSVSSRTEMSTKKSLTSATVKSHNSSYGSRSAKDPNFLTEFYANSRLHYLSTWGAECRQYVNKLQSEGLGLFPGRENLKRFVEEKRPSRVVDPDELNDGPRCWTVPRTIMHIDMDCFFVSVGLQKRPELKGKAVAVTHSKGKGELSGKTRKVDMEKERDLWMKKKFERRKKGTQSSVTLNNSDADDDFDDEESGDIEAESAADISDKMMSSKEVATAGNEVYSMAEIASCSYEARKAGVRNGMFVGNALKLCPDLVTIPYDFEAYKATSQHLYNTIASYTHDIEAVSCDELFVDCTELLSTTGATPLEFAAFVRDEIEEKTGCTASAGLGSNILLTRLATRVAKPNGQYHLQAGEEQIFIAKQIVRDLPGVGWSTSQRLEAMKVKTCADLQALSMSALQQEFGPKTGASLYKYCRGQDDRPIKMEKERKSVSAEVNYGIRFKENKDMSTFIDGLSKEVEKRLDAICVKGRTITLKLKVRSKGAPVETSKFMGHGVVDNFSKSVTLPVATNNPNIIAAECMSLFRALKAPVTDLRGIGIQVQRLEPISKKSEKQARQNILNFLAPKSKTTSPSAASNSSFTAPSSSTSKLVPSASDEVKTNTVPSDSHIGGAADNVEAERNRKELAVSSLPPLPSMSPVMQGPSRSSLATPERSLSASPTCYFPSPSQIDPAVLRELPPDIQAQITSEMKAYKRKKESTKQTAGGSQEAGCSHWESDPTVPMDDEPASREISSSPIVELPSFSQVDQSCFNALPGDIQAELVGAYAAEKNKATHVVTRQKQDSIVQDINKTRPVQLVWKHGAEKSPSKSPKKKSPQKKSPSPKKGSPKFKVPRGRAVSKRQAKRLDFTENDSEDQDVAEIRPTPIDKNKEVVKEEVNLCGAVRLSEVKVIVKEWIQSCEDPEFEDIERFNHYLQNLAKDKNLERVDLLLKFLKRTLGKVSSPGWTRALHDIHNDIQVCVKDIYGCELRIEL
ncbi:DNA repair protein REV1-like isoform X2 [Lineus longissimus]